MRSLDLLLLLVLGATQAAIAAVREIIENDWQVRRVKKAMAKLTPEQKIAKRLLQHFNCRCVMVPIVDQAEPTDEELVEALIESVFREEP